MLHGARVTTYLPCSKNQHTTVIYQWKCFSILAHFTGGGNHNRLGDCTLIVEVFPHSIIKPIGKL